MPQTIPTSFSFGIHSVRVVLRNGEPWFVGADVCAALEYRNASKSIADHVDDDERYNQSLERGGSLLLISESGLYALVLRSRKPEAVKFSKWITRDVLPSIRRTGAYSAHAADANAPTTDQSRYAKAAHIARSLLDLLRSFDMPEEKTHAIAIEHIRRETGVELASAFATIQHQLALTPERRAVLEREARRIVEMIPEGGMGSAHQLLSEITKAQRGVAALPAIA